MEGVSALLAGCPATGLAGGLGVTACAAAGVLLYRIARRKKPTHTTVNCWFCNLDTVVPYGNRNCWDCPHCEQYNGFQENGDYNKPIPAQYMEHLNHVVRSPPSPHALTQPPQWVSSQVLLCRRCSHHQTTKIKQLAAFTPREEGRYDEEIEVYRHHLEQMYKLCRPCQAAVEYYIKHQNRQLRALLLSHQFRRREADSTQSFCSSALKAPAQATALRALAFLACAFLLTAALHGARDPSTPGDALPPALPPGSNGSAVPDNGTGPGAERWQQLLGLLPQHAAERLQEAWAFGQSHQPGLVALGLLACLLAMLLAGRVGLRRIDALASCLWALLLGLHLAEQHLQAAPASWLGTLKLGLTSLCCLVGFAAAVATRKAMGPRRFRPRRRRGRPLPRQRRPGRPVPERRGPFAIPVCPQPAWLPAARRPAAVPGSPTGLALLPARPPQPGPLAGHRALPDASRLGVPVQWEPPALSGVSSRGASCCRLPLPAVRGPPLLPAPFPGALRGRLRGLQLGLPAPPQTPHQPRPPQPEGAEAAALPIAPQGGPQLPQQLGRALAPQRQPFHPCAAASAGRQAHRGPETGAGKRQRLQPPLHQEGGRLVAVQLCGGHHHPGVLGGGRRLERSLQPLPGLGPPGRELGRQRPLHLGLPVPESALTASRGRPGCILLPPLPPASPGPERPDGQGRREAPGGLPPGPSTAPVCESRPRRREGEGRGAVLQLPAWLGPLSCPQDAFSRLADALRCCPRPPWPTSLVYVWC